MFPSDAKIRKTLSSGGSNFTVVAYYRTTGEFVLNDVAYCSETTGEFVLNDVEWTNTPKMYKYTFLPHLVSYQEFHCTMV